MKSALLLLGLLMLPAAALGQNEPNGKRVAELIRRIPELQGMPMGNCGMPDVVGSFPGTGPTVAKQLVDLGHTAVPALIDLLGDARETRALAYRSPGDLEPCHARVGEAALQILERIAGRSFRVWVPGEEVPRGAYGRSSLPNARKWWKSIQEKGERALLVEEVRACDPQLVTLAARLVERYPDAALGPIIHAARHVKGFHTYEVPSGRAARGYDRPVHVRHAQLERALLIQLAAALPGAAPTAFLKEEMKTAPHLVQRVTAAFGLRRRGETGGVEAMIAEWKGLGDYGNPDHTGAIQDPINRSIRLLVVFLVTSGRAEAIRALGENLGDRPVHVRGLVSRALGTGAVPFNLDGCFGPREDRDPKLPVDGPTTEMVLRSMLADVAEDNAKFAGHAGWRIADQAARSLAQRFPDRYAFDISGSVPERDKMIQKLTAR